MSKLQEIAKKLKADTLAYLKVKNCDNGKELPEKVSQAFLEGNHNGDLSEYLQSLANKGISKVEITQRRKNGSSSKPNGPTQYIPLLTSKQTAQENPIQPTPMQQPTNNNANIPGLMGLSMIDVMDGRAAITRNQELKDEVAIWKREAEKQRKKKNEIRSKRDELQRELDKKKITEEVTPEPGIADKLIESILNNKQIVTGLASKLMPGGLNSPAPQANPDDNLGNYAKAVVQTARNCDENFNEIIYNVMLRIAEDPNFVEELNKLTNSNHLKKVQDA